METSKLTSFTEELNSCYLNEFDAEAFSKIKELSLSQMISIMPPFLIDNYGDVHYMMFRVKPKTDRECCFSVMYGSTALVVGNGNTITNALCDLCYKLYKQNLLYPDWTKVADHDKNEFAKLEEKHKGRTVGEWPDAKGKHGPNTVCYKLINKVSYQLSERTNAYRNSLKIK